MKQKSKNYRIKEWLWKPCMFLYRILVMKLKNTGNNEIYTNNINKMDMWEQVYEDVNEVVPELMGSGARNVCKQNWLSLS